MPQNISSPIGYQDGWLGVPRRVGPREFEWPFLVLGDVDTFIMTETWKAAEGVYRPMALKTPHPLWPFAYLVKETKPAPTGLGAEKWQRIYAKIPPVQTTWPGSRYITKPEYTPSAPAIPVNPYGASGGGDSRGLISIFTPYALSGNAYYTAGAGGSLYDDKTSKVYNPVKAITAQTIGYATGGTFTLTYGASTTPALAYNASAATINAALNALADVSSEGLTINCNVFLDSPIYGMLTFNLIKAPGVALISKITMNATSLTVNTSKNPVTVESYINAGGLGNTSGNNAQAIVLPTHVTIVGHGFSGGVDLAAVVAYSGGLSFVTTLFNGTSWGVIGADTLWIPNAGLGTLSPYSQAGPYGTTYTAPSVPPAASYVGGSRLTRTRILTTYYLPGVTLGIATEDDIILPADLQNPSDFLAALLTPLTGYQNWESDGPKPWQDFPIVFVATTQIKFEDLV